MAEAKEQVKGEMKQDEIRGSRIVIYGLKESEKEEKEEGGADWKEEEKNKVEEMARVMEVAMEGEVEVKFRAGKKGVGDRPRPLIVRISDDVDDETRERIFRNARRLAREEDWKRNFVAPDMTREQREAAKKEETELREKAERQTDEAKEGERRIQFKVVGQRGKRRIIEIPLRE